MIKTPFVPLEVRGSPIHGRGVFAERWIAEGKWIIEYAGRRVSEATAERLSRLHHTMQWETADGQTIDARHGGNESRWFNHSCEPNVGSREFRCWPPHTRHRMTRVWFYALRDIAEYEELTIDYRLEGGPLSRARCRCGAPTCRGRLGLISTSAYWRSLRV